jgi:alkylation response protein AidB-like acyl-CoA dehydrogenase
MWFTIALKLLGIGKTLLSWGRAALRWIFSDWRHIVIAVLSLFAAYHYLQAAKYHRQADRAVTAFERANKTIADMEAASEAARIAQIALNTIRTQDEKDVANETDRNNAIAQNEAGRAAIVYRDRWRVRNVCSQPSQSRHRQFSCRKW